MNKIKKNSTTKSISTKFRYISKNPLYSQKAYKNIFGLGDFMNKAYENTSPFIEKRSGIWDSMNKKSKEAWDNAWATPEKAGKSVGSIATSLGTMIDTGIKNSDIEDTSGIQAQINSIEAINPDTSNRESLINQWSNMPTVVIPSADDIDGSEGRKLASTATATLSGISTGATIGGPWGALAGGVLGLGSGLVGLFSGQAKARREQQRLTEEATEANKAAIMKFREAANNLDNNDFMAAMKNYSAFGGPIVNKFSDGGYLGYTHGSDFTNGVMHINTGGTHEKNPNEGVQIGISPDGTPNLVEEGEVIFNDYVYSNRLYATGGELKEFNLPEKYDKWTIAKIANELSKESEERPNDPTSIEGLKVSMDRLMQLQETKKANRAKKAVKKAFNTLPIEDQMALAQGLQAPEQITEPAQESSPLAVGDNLQAGYSPEQITEQGITDNRANALPEEEFAKGGKMYDAGGIWEAIRVGAPAVGNLLGIALNKRDYSPVEDFLEATNNNQTVTFKPGSGDYYPNYISPYAITSPIINQAAGTRRALMTNTGGNAAALQNALIANDYNTLSALGKARLEGEQYNYGLFRDAYNARMQRDQYNSTGAMQAAQYNASTINNALYNRALAAMNAKLKENASYDAALSSGLTSFFDNISSVAKDALTRRMAEEKAKQEQS